MKVIGVIPARMGASRFPGKPLAPILGHPMIHWVVEGARKSRLLNEIWVATDDVRIAESLAPLGVRVVMTESHLPSGTDRVWAAVANEDAEIVLNIQGDEPLTSGEHIDPLILALQADSEIEMATLGGHLEIDEIPLPQVVKVLVDQNSRAIYFSRHPIPYSRLTVAEITVPSVYKHIGIYAYRRNFLRKFCATGALPLELAEGLEQLRALHLGAKIGVVYTQQISCGVDTPEDVKKIENLIKGR